MVASMSDSLRSVSIRFSLASMPTTQFLVNERAPSESRRIDWSRFLMRTGLKTLS
jgi:hypothetical protein